MPSDELLMIATLIGMSLIAQVGELLVGHLEAAVAVDRPHQRGRAAATFAPMAAGTA